MNKALHSGVNKQFRASSLACIVGAGVAVGAGVQAAITEIAAITKHDAETATLRLLIAAVTVLQENDKPIDGRRRH